MHDEEKSQETQDLIRRIIGWSSLGIAVLFLSLFPSIFLFIFFIPAFILSGIMIGPDVADHFAECFAGILWRRVVHDPEPIYGIPESLIAKGKYAEAEAEYEKIIGEFPLEVKPHIDMVKIAVERLNDAELAEKLYQRGMSLLSDMESRNKLTERYSQIRTRIKTADDMKAKTVEFKTKGLSRQIDPGMPEKRS